MNDTTARLGLDIGRVLISPDPFAGTQGDTSFLRGTTEDALRTPQYPGMFDAVPVLARGFEAACGWFPRRGRECRRRRGCGSNGTPSSSAPESLRIICVSASSATRRRDIAGN